MLKQHCNDGKLIVVEDSCLRIVWKCSADGEVLMQRKRRKKAMTDDECNWMMPCPAHPKKGRCYPKHDSWQVLSESGNSISVIGDCNCGVVNHRWVWHIYGHPIFLQNDRNDK